MAVIKDHTEVNYYIFDEITKDSDNQYWGHLNGKTVEVYPLDGDETDEEIKAVGFAKCDAPKGYTETFVVEETAWAVVYATVAPEAPGTCPICEKSFADCEHFESLND